MLISPETDNMKQITGTLSFSSLSLPAFSNLAIVCIKIDVQLAKNVKNLDITERILQDEIIAGDCFVPLLDNEGKNQTEDCVPREYCTVGGRSFLRCILPTAPLF